MFHNVLHIIEFLKPTFEIFIKNVALILVPTFVFWRIFIRHIIYSQQCFTYYKKKKFILKKRCTTFKCCAQSLSKGNVFSRDISCQPQRTTQCTKTKY